MKKRTPAKRPALARAPRTEQRPQRRHSTPAASFTKAMVVAACIAALAMVDLSQRVLIAQSSLAMSDVQRQIQSAKTERQRLDMALLVLESPGRIQQRAVAKLRMIQPDEVAYVQLPHVRPQKPGRVATGSRISRLPSPAADQGVVQALLEKIAGQVQLLPLGMPVN